MGYKEYTVFIDMNKQRLQELAGIKPVNELEINNPNKIFSWDRYEELLYDKENIHAIIFEDDSVVFQTELLDVGFDEFNVLKTFSSLEEARLYLKNDYEDASNDISCFINLEKNLIRLKIPYQIEYTNDIDSDDDYIFIEITCLYDDIKPYIKEK